MKFGEERQGTEKRFFSLCEKVVLENGFILYDLDYVVGQKLLRLYIMNEKTQTALIDDCVLIDKALTPFFENLDWLPAELTLEVSSPGAERNLKTLEHFKWVQGKKISLTLFKSLGDITSENLSKSFKGAKKIEALLKDTNEKSVELEIEDKKVIVDFEHIKKAHLIFEMNQK